eukprot:scaffold579608_cov50-Prasinocladus_malaysianus.AAC.1
MPNSSAADHDVWKRNFQETLVVQICTCDKLKVWSTAGAGAAASSKGMPAGVCLHATADSSC